MRKIKLAAILTILSISLVGCNNPKPLNNIDSNINSNETNDINNSEENSENNNLNDGSNNNINSNSNNNNINNSVNISEDKAKEIALQHAGLSSDKISFIKVELDLDDGIRKYDIEFFNNNVEYSYEIDANTGEILSYERD